MNLFCYLLCSVHVSAHTSKQGNESLGVRYIHFDCNPANRSNKIVAALIDLVKGFTESLPNYECS